MPRRAPTKKSTRRPRRKPRAKQKSQKVSGPREVTSTAQFRPLVTRPIRWVMPKGEIPSRVLVKMKYNDAYINHQPGTLNSRYAWNLNSIFSPDALGGNQPTLHDAMNSLYGKYKVSAAKVNITVRNRSASRTLVGLLATDTAVITSPNPDIIQRSANVSAMIEPTGEDSNSGSLSMYVPLRTVAGPKFNDSVYSANFGADPTDITHLYMLAGAVDGANNVDLAISVSIDFYTECFDPVRTRAID